MLFQKSLSRPDFPRSQCASRCSVIFDLIVSMGLFKLSKLIKSMVTRDEDWPAGANVTHTYTRLCNGVFQSNMLDKSHPHTRTKWKHTKFRSLSVPGDDISRTDGSASSWVRRHPGRTLRRRPFSEVASAPRASNHEAGFQPVAANREDRYDHSEIGLRLVGTGKRVFLDVCGHLAEIFGDLGLDLWAEIVSNFQHLNFLGARAT
ncbi:uncharacterized protein LOC117226842 [Megalopta genalis]|uniref:uncharacterized protein LOC117226842 n=1 Tax=Megalopta genalis TaxID=115081 RepID=UPI003FD6197A